MLIFWRANQSRATFCAFCTSASAGESQGNWSCVNIHRALSCSRANRGQQTIAKSIKTQNICSIANLWSTFWMMENLKSFASRNTNRLRYCRNKNQEYKILNVRRNTWKWKLSLRKKTNWLGPTAKICPPLQSRKSAKLLAKERTSNQEQMIQTDIHLYNINWNLE